MSSQQPPKSFVVVPELDETIRRSLEDVASLITAHHRFLVVSHAEPDGDAIGSSLALAHILTALGKRVVVLNADAVPYNLTFLPGADEIVSEPPGGARNGSAPFDVVCVLDCNRAALLGRAAAALELADELIVIDHHTPAWDEPQVPTAMVSDPCAPAVGELLYHLARTLDVALELPLAECLYTTLVTDTGSFRYRSTTPRALCVAADLVAHGVDTWHISSEIYESQPLERVELLGEVLRTLELSACRRLAMLRIDARLQQRVDPSSGLLDGVINHARSIRGVEVAAQLREIGPDTYELTLRSRGTVDVGELVANLGGERGGRFAGRCTLNGPLADIVSQLTACFSKLIDGQGDPPSSTSPPAGNGKAGALEGAAATAVPMSAEALGH